MSFKDLLKKDESNSSAGESPAPAEEVPEVKETEKKASKKSSKKKETKTENIVFEPLNAEDTQYGSTCGFLRAKRRGEERGKNFVIDNFCSPYPRVPNVPKSRALTLWQPSNAAVAAQRRLSEQQLIWQNNVVDSDFLKKETPKVITSQNPMGLRRYLFIAALKANANGMIYYLLPLLFNLIFLTLNFTMFAFVPNFIFAVFTTALTIGVWKIASSQNFNLIKKLLLIIFFIVFYALYIFGHETFYPENFALIHYPFAVKLILIIFGIYYFGKFYAMILISYHQDCTADFGNVVQIYAGAPRIGKTSSMVQDGYVIALMKWRQLQYDMYLWHSREREILERNDEDELLEYHEIKIAYNFYIMRRCIPCLFSNIPIQDKNGVRAHELEVNHLKGVYRLPIYTVVLIDEIGAVLKAELGVSKERPYDVSDMFRLGGHFLKWCVIGCEQDYNNVYIDCRRVVGQNKIFLSQEWVCRPILLLKIFAFLQLFLSDSMDKRIVRHRLSAKILIKIERFIRSIGFRKKIYTVVGNTQTEVLSNTPTKYLNVLEENKRLKVRYIPAKIVADYDDRSYKQAYPSYYDKEIFGRLHQKLHIDGKNFDYVRNYVSESKTLNKKRQAVDSNVARLGFKQDSCDKLIDVLEAIRALNDTK